jgi:hypothetical protein
MAENGTTQAMKQWWIDKIMTSDFPHRKNDFNAAQSFCSHQKVKRITGFFSTIKFESMLLVILKRSQRDNKKQCYWNTYLK